MSYPLFKVYTDDKKILKTLSPVLASGFLNEGIPVSEFKNSLSSYFELDNISIICFSSSIDNTLFLIKKYIIFKLFIFFSLFTSF